MAEGDGEGQATGAHADTSEVFISYASQDAAVAKSIVENLEQHGLKCWMASLDVRPGMVYADAIVRAINEAKALVLVLSAAAMAPSHVGREVERAAAKKKHITAGESAFNVARMMGHSRSVLVDQVYAHSMQSGIASVAENVTARALGVKPQLRVIEGGQRDVRQPLEEVSKKAEDIALTA